MRWTVNKTGTRHLAQPSATAQVTWGKELDSQIQFSQPEHHSREVSLLMLDYKRTMDFPLPLCVPLSLFCGCLLLSSSSSPLSPLFFFLYKESLIHSVLFFLLSFPLPLLLPLALFFPSLFVHLSSYDLSS